MTDKALLTAEEREMAEQNREHSDGECAPSCPYGKINKLLETVAPLRAALAQAQVEWEARWIAVTERLPEPNTAVLVELEGYPGEIYGALIHHDGEYWYTNKAVRRWCTPTPPRTNELEKPAAPSEIGRGE